MARVESGRSDPFPTVLAGVSTGLSVLVSSYSPLETGLTYEIWLVGHNAQGEGPASPHIDYTA